MANSYDVYTFASFNTSSMTGTLSSTSVSTKNFNGKPISEISNSSSDNTSVLGDVAHDTFTVGTSAITFTYVGIVSVTESGSPVSGFVAFDGTNYRLFVDHSTTLKPDAPQTVTATADNTSNSSTWWDINAGAPGCFVAGTLIATPTGQVPVESLAPGDLVLTADGRVMPVRWLGRSVISRVFADPVRVLPIRIRAGALGENLPVRDLVVSPGHAIRVDDVLVNASALVNGTSIVRQETAPLVFTYYHVELDTHALLLAEGAPAESFLDGVEDMGFANWDEREATAGEEMPYPRVKSQRQLPREVRERLAARAAALFGPVAEAA
jgi:hypothetical protein